jgi:hypothetical protein
VHKAGLEVEDLILEPLASSEAVLSPEEKEAGIALVDIGVYGRTTNSSLIVVDASLNLVLVNIVFILLIKESFSAGWYKIIGVNLRKLVVFETGTVFKLLYEISEQCCIIGVDLIQ